MSWPRSLEGRLVLGLAAIFVVATALMGAAVVYEGYSAARALGDEELAHVFLDEFIADVAWVIPVFALAVFAAVVWTIRRGLAPLRAASEMAARIAPASTGVRLPVDGLPLEVVPLVEAVNDALDRLERGFIAQRQFTASAAHELRTPLAILTAGLDALDEAPEVAKLRADAARMNRLVEQLLRVARLDALPIDVSSRVDLRATAADAVAYLAPWAIARNRSLAFEDPEASVWVRGNADAISDALRNLVENAVAYAPPGTEATVAVAPDGKLSVLDRGPGIPPQERGRIFERFWRGRSATHASTGTGLGLAIVAEIARAHRAPVEVADVAGGGTCITLHFPPAKPP